MGSLAEDAVEVWRIILSSYCKRYGLLICIYYFPIEYFDFKLNLAREAGERILVLEFKGSWINLGDEDTVEAEPALDQMAPQARIVFSTPYPFVKLLNTVALIF